MIKDQKNNDIPTLQNLTPDHRHISDDMGATHSHNLVSTGWKWMMDDLYRSRPTAKNACEDLLLSCETYLRFIKHNPKLCKIMFLFPIDEGTPAGRIGPRSVEEFLNQLVERAHIEAGLDCANTAQFASMIWSIAQGLGTNLLKQIENGDKTPTPRKLVEENIRPKCRLIL